MPMRPESHWASDSALTSQHQFPNIQSLGSKLLFGFSFSRECFMMEDTSSTLATFHNRPSLPLSRYFLLTTRDVLDSQTGSSLTSIPMNSHQHHLIFDVPQRVCEQSFQLILNRPSVGEIVANPTHSDSHNRLRNALQLTSWRPSEVPYTRSSP